MTTSRADSSAIELIDWKAYGPFPVFGVDEVGRGCLAGPVFAAAATLKSDLHLNLLTDSKKISEKRRELISPLIHKDHEVFIASASVEEIDELNILQASLLAMLRAVEGLSARLGISAGHVLVDGNQKIPGLAERLPGFQQTTIVKGDLRAAPISAASIVAKVARDHLMLRLGSEFTEYGFEKHKGYGSLHHRQAIQRFGPTRHHRKSFSGVKEFLSSEGPSL